MRRDVPQFGSKDDSDLRGNLYDDTQTLLRKRITLICQVSSLQMLVQTRHGQFLEYHSDGRRR